MSDELLELARRVESLELVVAGVLQRLPGDGDQRYAAADVADNRRALFDLIREAFYTGPLTVNDLTTAALVVDLLDKAGVRAPRGADQ